MRITKRIEEYINRQVREKAEANVELRALKVAADLERKHFNTAYQAIANNAKTAYTQLLRDMKVDKPETFTLSLSGSWGIPDYLPAVIAYHEACRKMDQKIRTTVDDILVSIEMSGDKDTLNQLLEAINFD